MKMLISRELFAAYCGLLKAGYDLYDPHDSIAHQVNCAVQEMAIPQASIAYFECARTEQITVNPYYPRGNDMGAMCFFADDRLEDGFRFLRESGSPEVDDPSFHDWIAGLSGHLTAVQETEGFASAFASWQAALSRRFVDVESEIRAAERRLTDALGIRQDISFAPNPLQSPFQTDFVRRDGQLIVIATAFVRESAIHEALHPYVAAHRGTLAQMLTQRGLRLFADEQRLRQYGYLWDDSPESQLHAMEECVVRALCGVVDDSLDLFGYIERNRAQGFVCIADMIEKMSHMSVFPPDVRY